METSRKFFESMCRTCMQELVEVFSYEATTKPEQQQWHSIIDVIEKCESLRIDELLAAAVHQIEIQINDELPKKICPKCLDQLQTIYRFQQMCIKSDQQMREMICNGFDFKHSIEETLEHKLCTTNDYLVQESPLACREQRIVVDSGNIFAEAIQQPIAADTLQNLEQDNVNDYVKREPSVHIDDKPDIDNNSDGAALHSTVTIKNVRVSTIETDKESDSISFPTKKCPRCTKTFKQLRHLQEHLKHHQKRDEEKDITKPKEKLDRCGFKCDICNLDFHQAESLQKHRMEHDDKGELPKYACEHSLVNFSVLKRHLHDTHSIERPLLCRECGKAFSHEKNLRQHSFLHRDIDPFECPHCPKKFRSKNYLSRHIKIHQDKKTHVCDICGYRFAEAYQLTIHKNYHNGIKPHKCDFCEMSFVTMGSKRRHMRTHTGEKPYKCKYCERVFSQCGDHLKHLKRIHLGDNVHRCELCPCAYRVASELRAHYPTHKNDDEETRKRNIQALREADAKLQLRYSEKEQKRKNP